MMKYCAFEEPGDVCPQSKCLDRNPLDDESFCLFSPNLQTLHQLLTHVMLTVSVVAMFAGDLSALKEKSFSLQEGAKYRLKIHFKVRWADVYVHVP